MTQKVAYVTGGMGGIGTAICRKLHDMGYKVIAGCGPSRDFNKWLGEQSAQGYTFYASVGNVSDWDSTKAAFDKVKAEHGTISILVNNAGITRDGVFRKMSLGPVRPDQLLRRQGRHARLHHGAGAGSGQQGRHGKHRQPRLHRH